MKARSFFLQWLLTLIVLFIVDLIFDLIFGDMESITSGRRIAWILTVNLLLTTIFYKKKDAKNM